MPNEPVSTWERRILEKCPSSKSDDSIGIRQLIENLNGLADYSGYLTLINSLVETKHLKKLHGSMVRRTKKRRYRGRQAPSD